MPKPKAAKVASAKKKPAAAVKKAEIAKRVSAETKKDVFKPVYNHRTNSLRASAVKAFGENDKKRESEVRGLLKDQTEFSGVRQTLMDNGIKAGEFDTFLEGWFADGAKKEAPASA